MYPQKGLFWTQIIFLLLAVFCIYKGTNSIYLTCATILLLLYIDLNIEHTIIKYTNKK